ncbi:Hypothetical protein R9X50_00564300 [Acrodontium crateriforme]|uniref:polynucleotide adenylyltransferase n=1 Tax=Acrodontium crateriforme TaxID=150365 RepID=A0AAQ3RBP0_9PEZI|nr:Hypothetical protein R9X50_00564300 [Acrodontium crateriforme]
MASRRSPEYRSRDGRSRHSYYDDSYRQPDRYEDQKRERDRDFHDSRSGHGGGGFTFRGAAQRDNGYSRSHESSRYEDNHYRPQEGQFTFRAQGPSAPRFPEEQPPPRSDRRSGRDRNGGGRGRGGNRGGRGGRGGYVYKPKQAHSRAILRESGREKTPEQLEGMNNSGTSHFMEVLSDSEYDDQGGVIDLTHESEDESEGPRKRTKTKASSDAEAARPKWSNPDPYTVLPPPETLGAPKKDIVQVIRKAKVEVAAKPDDTNAVKENVDFISFNFGDDDDDDDDDSSIAEINKPPPNAPTAPSAQRDHNVDESRRNPPAQYGREMRSSAVTNDIPPPPPPYGLVMPSDAELRERRAGPETMNKRKRKGQETRDNRLVGDIVDEWLPNHSDPTPWCERQYSQIESPALRRLHEEILDFYDFVKPHDHEETVRADLINRIESVVRTCHVEYSHVVQIRSFGSYAAGLYLPTADMDLVAVTPNYLNGGRKTYCQSPSSMRKLGSYLVSRGIAKPGSLIALTKTRVPIIKFTDLKTGIKVDISFENDSGLRANETFRKWKEEYPAMPVLVVMIKQLVAMRGLNEVFSGGIGGFSIICLVVSMLQLLPEVQTHVMDPEQHYGELLVNFLNLYGNKFSLKRTGITFVPVPGYYDKVRYPMGKQKESRLTIVDPNNADNDISGGSMKIDQVFDLFSQAHSAIENKLYHVGRGEDDSDSILGCILGGNYTSFIRQRDRLYDLVNQRAAPPQRVVPPPTQNKPVFPLPSRPATFHGLPHKPPHQSTQPMIDENTNTLPQAAPLPRKVQRSLKTLEKTEAKMETKKIKKKSKKKNKEKEAKKEARKAKNRDLPKVATANKKKRKQNVNST